MRTADARNRPAPAAATLVSFLLSVTFTLASPMSATAQQLPPTGFEAGEPFPTLTLPSLDGRALSVADFRGHKTIVHVFASW